MKDFVVCSTNEFGNLTQYRRYEVIDENSSQYKIIDDDGVTIWVEKVWFKTV